MPCWRSVDVWYVYLLHCADETLYCGVTTDMARRLAAHNGLRVGGAKYTQTRRPVRVALCVAQPDRAAACRLEARIKRARRADKLALLAAHADATIGRAEGTCGRAEVTCAQAEVTCAQAEITATAVIDRAVD